MAEPRDSTTILNDVDAIIQDQFWPDFQTQWSEYLHEPTNKIFRPEKEIVSGDGKTMQYELGPADSVRWSTDPLGAVAAPAKFSAGELKVRFSQNGGSSNDFSEVSCSAQVSDIDVQNAGRGTIVNLVDRIWNQTTGAYDFKLALHRNLPRTGIVAYVNGTPTTNANQWRFVSGAAAASNTVGLRVTIDGGPIAALRTNDRISFLNSSGVARVSNVRITDVNPADSSIGVEFVTSGIATDLSVNGSGSLATVADNDLIVFGNPSGSNEYNANMWSLGAYFTIPSASETFIGGVDRTGASYRWMIPTTTRAGESANSPLTRSMFDDLAIAMGFRAMDQHNGMVFDLYPDLHQKLRNEIGEAAFIPWTAADAQAKERFASFGSMGLNYQHPQFGIIKIVANPLAPRNTARVIATATWRALYYGFMGLYHLPGNGGNKWYRVTAETPNTGLSKIWKSDWYALQTDWCDKPWLNGQITYVSAT